jgi:hypothetical protein
MVYFANQKYQFWCILEGLGMENVGLFYNHLAHFTAIWNIFMAVWYFLVIWYIFFYYFGVLYHEKSGNPGWKLLFSSVSIFVSKSHQPRRSAVC